jgi:hypothetical protein
MEIVVLYILIVKLYTMYTAKYWKMNKEQWITAADGKDIRKTGTETTKSKEDEDYLLHSAHGPFLLKTTNYSNQNFIADNPIRVLKLAMEEIQRNMARQTILWFPAANINTHRIQLIELTAC